MAALTASMRDVVMEYAGTDKHVRAARRELAKPGGKITPARAAKLRAAHAAVDVYENGSRASVESLLTLAGPPMSFVEHACRMQIYTVDTAPRLD